MGPTYVLHFKIQPQEGQNWCWAANAASISYFYEGVQGMTQCQIANKTFYRNDCCQSPNPCDNEGDLQNALAHVTHNLAAPPSGVISTREISDQINNNRVIGVMILWPNLYAHFVTIYGYDGSSGVDYVLVADPLNPKYMYTYFDLVDNYAQAGGKWHESYFTVSHAPAVMAEIAVTTRSLALPAKKINTIRERQNAIIRSTKVPVKNARLHAHDINYIVFEDLLKGYLTYKKTGFRILKKGKKIYLADFSDTEHQLIGLTDDADYIALYQKKWQQVIARIHQIKKNYTIEVVQVPQLGVEGFKLEFTGEDNIQFLPIRNSFLFDQDNFYKADQFQHTLTIAANEKVKHFLEKN